MTQFTNCPKYLFFCVFLIGLTSFVNAQGTDNQFNVRWGTHLADDTSPALGQDYGFGTTGFKKYLLKLNLLVPVFLRLVPRRI